MLQTIRKYRRSVLGVVSVGLVGLAMGGFGVSMGGKQSGTYAIKVGDSEISYADYSQVRRGIDARYRQMLGNNYAEMLKTFNVNVAQQAVDSTIQRELLSQFAKKMGLDGSSQSVQQMIHNEIFAGQFDQQRYVDFLASQGLTPVQFENELRKDIAREQLSALFTEATKASLRETKAMLARDKTTYSFLTLSVDSSEIKKSIAEPTAEQISKYYDDNLTDFQTPAQVAYKYLALKPADFVSKVPLTQEDIELEFTDNPSAYQSQPEVRFSQIMLKIPENGSAEQKDKIKKNAEEIAQKLKGGEEFSALVKLFSQDPASAMKGGDAGWFAKDKLPQELAAKAFTAEPGVVSDLIETDKAFYLIKVEEKKDPQQKSLDQVKDEITRKIQIREAPAILVIQAQDLHEAWTKSGKSLADFAKENSLAEPKISPKLSREQDPEEELKDLSANILASAESKQQIVEIGDTQVLVEVTETVEEGVESLEVAKSKIVETLKTKSAKEQARTKAQQILESIKKSEVAGLQEAATKNSLKTEEILEVNISSAKGVVADPAIRDKVFSYSSAPQKPSEVYEVGNSFVLVELTGIKAPKPEDLESAVAGMQKGLSKELADFSLDAFISKLKAETTIDIQPGLLAE